MTITEKLRALVVEAGQYGDLSACVKCADLLTLIEIVEAAEAYQTAYSRWVDGTPIDDPSFPDNFSAVHAARRELTRALAKNRGAKWGAK